MFLFSIDTLTIRRTLSSARLLIYFCVSAIQCFNLLFLDRFCRRPGRVISPGVQRPAIQQQFQGAAYVLATPRRRCVSAEVLEQRPERQHRETRERYQPRRFLQLCVSLTDIHSIF